PRLRAVSRSPRITALSLSHAPRFRWPLAARGGGIGDAHARARSHARRCRRRSIRQDRAADRPALSRRAGARRARAARRPAGTRVSTPSARGRFTRPLVLGLENVGALFPGI